MPLASGRSGRELPLSRTQYGSEIPGGMVSQGGTIQQKNNLECISSKSGSPLQIRSFADKHALTVGGTHHSRCTFRRILALPHRILWHYLSVYVHVCLSSRSTPTVMLSDTSAHAATHARLPTHLVRHAIWPGRHLQDPSHIMPLALHSYSRFVLLS